MQKVLRRAHLARRQEGRKRRIRNEKILQRDRANYRQSLVEYKREETDAIRNARQAWKEDYELGPLRPWRGAVGEITTTREERGVASGVERLVSENYGTYTNQRATPPVKPKKDRIRDWLIREGDRVCVIEGRTGTKGMIGTVSKCHRDSETVEVKGVNLIDVRLPQYMVPPGGKKVTTMEEPIPYSSVRLVHPLPDPESGEMRDMIVRELERRPKRGRQFGRFLVPQGIKIPWPEPKQESHVDQPGDTLRIDVEAKTFMPTLLRPPMPESVIDELRNKYSKFRTRHDDEWVEMMEEKDREAERLEELKKEMIPKGARNVARGRSRSSDGTFLSSKEDPVIDSKILETIGAHMAAKRQAQQQRESGFQKPLSSPPSPQSSGSEQATSI